MCVATYYYNCRISIKSEVIIIKMVKNARHRKFYMAERLCSFFSVSESGVLPVQSYIKNQYEHHKTKAYQDEVCEFLNEYKIEYDEKYMWD